MLEHLPKLVRPLLPLAAVALIAAATAYAAGVPSSSPPAPDGLSVAVDSTPGASGVTGSKGITIHSSRRQAQRDPTVVNSIKLSGLTSPERVRALGTVAPAYCVGSDIKGTDHLESPCRQLEGDHVPTAHYPIRVEAHIYKASRPGEPSSPSTVPLKDGVASATCTFDRHHCPLSIAARDVLGAGPKKYLNLDVIAWTRSPDRNPKDRMDLDCFELGRHCDTGTPTNAPVPRHPGAGVQQPGQLGLVRLGDAYDAGSKAKASSTRIDDPDVAVAVSRAFEGGTVVRSAELDDLAPGDVLQASGSAELTGDGFDHLGGSYWVLARDPGTIAAQPGTPDRYLSPLNGVNCLGAHGVLTDTLSGYCSATREPPTLPLQQFGLGKVPRHAPSTMYLNYVVLASDGSVPEGSTPSAHVDSVSVDMTCLPQPRAGSAAPCSFGTP